jgi:hypothetical protein
LAELQSRIHWWIGKSKFLIEGLHEHPALVKLRPEVCLRQIEDGLKIAAEKLNALFSEIIAVGLDSPGPASTAGLLSPNVSTNFIHPTWAGCDIREGFASVTCAGRCEFNSLVFIDLAELAFCYSCWG